MSHSNGHLAEIGSPPPTGLPRVAEIAADGIVHAPSEAVFAFLSDLENHWLIADRFVDVLRLNGKAGDRNGGWVRLRGPLGLRRTASTRVLAAEPPRLMAGVAEVDASTRARIEWRLRPQGHATAVRLTAKIDVAGPLDRVLLALGGRWWLRRRFAGALARLAGRFEGNRSADMPPLGRLLMGALSLRWGLKGGRA
jgi:hypothetical protein